MEETKASGSVENGSSSEVVGRPPNPLAAAYRQRADAVAVAPKMSLVRHPSLVSFIFRQCMIARLVIFLNS